MILRQIFNQVQTDQYEGNRLVVARIFAELWRITGRKMLSAMGLKGSDYKPYEHNHGYDKFYTDYTKEDLLGAHLPSMPAYHMVFESEKSSEVLRLYTPYSVAILSHQDLSKQWGTPIFVDDPNVSFRTSHGTLYVKLEVLVAAFETYDYPFHLVFGAFQIDPDDTTGIEIPLDTTPIWLSTTVRVEPDKLCSVPLFLKNLDSFGNVKVWGWRTVEEKNYGRAFEGEGFLADISRVGDEV